MSKLCAEIHRIFNSSRFRRFTFPFKKDEIPTDGVYILFEKREFAHNADRIVRIGTHTGKGQLPSRLQQHFIKENKDRSIFRKNIGRAILNSTNDPYIDQWNWDLTTRKAKKEYRALINKHKQEEIEKQVTAYIQIPFSFIVFPVTEKNQRLYLESRIISAVSLCNECHPSKSWLGQHSPKPKIRESGLWQVNELYKETLSLSELAELKKIVFRKDSV